MENTETNSQGLTEKRQEEMMIKLNTVLTEFIGDTNFSLIINSENGLSYVTNYDIEDSIKVSAVVIEHCIEDLQLNRKPINTKHVH